MNFGSAISKIYIPKQFNLIMNNKKGVSDIVVTILLVLLALAAIAIVWGFIKGQLTGSQSEILKAQACLNLKLDPISCDISGQTASVRYKLESSSTNLTGVRVLIEKTDGSSSPETVPQASVPKELETVVYNTSTASADAKKFSVAGTIMIGAQEVACTETSQVDCK